MTTVNPGDEVTVTITGTADDYYSAPQVRTPMGSVIDWFEDDPDVKVTVRRPDRPTRREVLACHPAVRPYGSWQLPMWRLGP